MPTKREDLSASVAAKTFIIHYAGGELVGEKHAS